MDLLAQTKCARPRGFPGVRAGGVSFSHMSQCGPALTSLTFYILND